MEFHLSWQNNTEMFMLPITPSRFELTNPHINKVVNINELGDINLIGKRGLSDITIESFFPNQNYYFCKTTPLDPQRYIDMILKWKNSNKPIRLIITDTNINMAVSIENFTYGKRDGTGDIYFTLELKEYRFLKVNSMKEVKVIPDEYTVRDGDNLWTIAKKETGNGNNYKVIQEDTTKPLIAGSKVPLAPKIKKYEGPTNTNYNLLKNLAKSYSTDSRIVTAKNETGITL